MYAELYEEFVGKPGPVAEFVPTAEAIARFATSFGDPDPIYVNEEYAKSTVYGGIIAPPTFAFTLYYPPVEGFRMPPAGLIHGNQGFEYIKPIYAGKKHFAQSTIVKVFEKRGMLFLDQENAVLDENMEPCVKMVMTTVIKGTLFDNWDPRDLSLPCWELGTPDTDEVAEAPAPLVDVKAVKVGDVLPEVVLPAYDRIDIAKYAGASGDFNRIHIDDASAQMVGFPGVIAHGMLTVALETVVLKKWFGTETVVSVKKLNVKFASPALVGDVPTAKAEVIAVEGNEVTMNVVVEGTKAAIISGTATVVAK